MTNHASQRKGGYMKVTATKLLTGLCAFALGCSPEQPSVSEVTAAALTAGNGGHVLVISIDGFHEFDLERYVAAHPTSAMADLVHRGVSYTHVTGSAPTDSFPGTLAYLTGGSPRTTGIMYDNTYSRHRYSPPGSGCATRGTEMLYDEGVDLDLTNVFTPMDPTLLPLDPDHGCTPVLPHQYLQVNTVFEVMKAHGLRTAFSDKHPSYDLLNGPSGHGVDDLFTPEADANDAACCIDTTEANDTLKVNAVVNWIDGYNATRTNHVGAPNIMGMNFQAVNIAQKEGQPGYINANGDLSPKLAAAYDFVDRSVGKMVNELRRKNLLGSTLVVLTAKHGNSPIDPAVRQALDDGPYIDLAEAIQPGLIGNLTDDDHAIVWLTDSSKTAQVVAAYNANKALLGIDTVYSGAQIEQLLGGTMDPDRRPDIIVKPVYGVIYTSHDKSVEHGSMFFETDLHVPLVVSRPDLNQGVVNTPVTTTQIAPTILQSLGLSPNELQAVQREHTQQLPGTGIGDCN